MTRSRAFAGTTAAVAIVVAVALLRPDTRRDGEPAAAPVSVASVAAAKPALTPPAAGQTAALSPVASPTPAVDRVAEELAPLLARSGAKKEMFRRLRAEGRDRQWAERSEAMLHDEYAALPSTKGVGRSVEVRCGTTLCEVAGSRASASVQTPGLAARMWGKGYHNMGSSFGIGASGDHIFVTYYQREAPVQVKAGTLPEPSPSPTP